jgi:hypothetical protein
MCTILSNWVKPPMRFIVPVRLEWSKSRSVPISARSRKLLSLDTFGVMTSSVLAWGYYCNDIPLHSFRSFRYESWSVWNVSCQSLGWIKSRLKELTWVIASCLLAYPFTKGVSYVWANAKPSHEEGHHMQMVHDVRHLRYGAGVKKVVRRTVAM